MPPKIQLIFPNPKLVRKTEDGYAFRFGLNISAPVLAVTLILIGLALSALLLSTTMGATPSVAWLVFFQLAYGYRTLVGRLGREVIVSRTGITLRKREQIEASFDTDKIHRIKIPFPLDPGDLTTFEDRDGNVLGTAPGYGQILAGGLPAYVPPSAHAEVVNQDQRNFDAEKQSPVLALLGYLVVGLFSISAGFGIFSKVLTSFQFSALTVLVGVACFALVVFGSLIGSKSVGLAGLFIASAPHENGPRITSVGETQPVLRNLFRIGMGLAPDDNQREYRCKAPAQIPSEVEVKQHIVFNTLVACLFFNLVLIGIPFGLVAMFTNSVPRLHPAYLLLVPVLMGFNVWLIKNIRTGAQSLREGLQTLDAVIQLGETPTLNGDPIEVVDLRNNASDLLGGINDLYFPHTVTAAGKTYHLNLSNFQPVLSPQTNPEPTSLRPWTTPSI